MASSRLLNSVNIESIPGTPYLAPWMDLTKGGQFGYIPRIGTVDKDGRVKSEIINHTSYLRRDLIPILLNYPRFFDHMPNTSLLVSTLKSLVEERALRIDGINPKLSVEYTETPIGAAGETIVEPTKVRQERSSITFTFSEVMGKAIQRFIEFMIKYGIANPHTNTPQVSSYINISNEEYMYTLDFYSFTMAFIEPDPTNQYAVDGFICTNCWFTEAGDRLGTRDIQGPKEKLEITTTINPILTCDPLTVQYCNELLQNLTILRQDPKDILLPAMQEVDPMVSSSDGMVGFNRGTNL